MSFVILENNSKRDFNAEAELQTKILEQKSREEYLTLFSQLNDSTSIFGDADKMERRSEKDSKVCIPVNAKAILEKWMYEHRLYCYPTKIEKHALSVETGLSVQKISNWFINSRRRMLPKMLQAEGRSVNNFTISRKKKKNVAMALTSTRSNCMLLNEATSLADYVNQEESKVIDQSSIFYGDEFTDDNSQHSGTRFENVLQQIVMPYIEPYTENSQLSYQSVTDGIQQYDDQKSERSLVAIGKAHEIPEPQSSSSSLNVTRGIIYDQSTQSKCIYVVINSPS